MHTRRNFSSSTKRLAYDRSNGICECHRVWQLPTYKIGCGVKLGGGNIFYEHITPDRLDGMTARKPSRSPSPSTSRTSMQCAKAEAA